MNDIDKRIEADFQKWITEYCNGVNPSGASTIRIIHEKSFTAAALPLHKEIEELREALNWSLKHLEDYNDSVFGLKTIQMIIDDHRASFSLDQKKDA